jgi:tetratricopeptide (TPR) repeat protein
MVAPALNARELINRGLTEHQAGRLDAAEALYRQGLAADPHLQQGWRLLSVLTQQRGRFQDCLPMIERALALGRAGPDLANLANALNQLGRPEEAAAAASEALRLDPRLVSAHSNLGVANRTLGHLEAAAQNFAAAAALQPTYADAHANLGVLLTELGRPEEAEAPLRTAAQLSPQSAEVRFNLGNALLRQMRFPEARELYLEAIRLRPTYAEAHGNLAAACKGIGDLDQSLAHYAEAARLAPRDLTLLQNYALMLAELRRYAEAIPVYEHSLAIEPNQPATHTNLGSAIQEFIRDKHSPDVLPLLDRAILAHRHALALMPELFAAQANLGLALLARGHHAEAVKAFERALELEPKSAESYSNLGQCLLDVRRFDDAEVACRKAIALNPTLPEAHSTLGNVFIGRNQVAQAEPHFRTALELRPTMAGGWCNLGVSLFRQGRSAEAEQVYLKAVELEPHMPDGHWNLALAYLQRGLYAEGFAEYEWRLKRSGRLRQDAGLHQPLWDGSDLEGRTILVHAEQGFGDAIQCARFVPQVAERGGKVILLARKPLKRLFEAIPGIDRFAPDEEPPPPVDFRLPMFSLPRHFVQDVKDLATPEPYLAVPEEPKAAWAEKLAALAPKITPEGRRVGIVWSGNLTSEVEIGRSIPLKRLAPLAKVAGVQLISLQKGDGLDHLDDPELGFEVTRLDEVYDKGDFAETAAVMANLDLVISCDTAAAHLAGAIGKPVWIAVNRISDWRWMEEREDTPWYPTMRIFRQPTLGDWDSVFERMAEALAA